jgi:hypothetical protein
MGTPSRARIITETLADQTMVGSRRPLLEQTFVQRK